MPRWEVRQMIREGVALGIQEYERLVVAPRHSETQGALRGLTETVGGFKDVLTELNGGVKAVKYIGGIILGASSLAGGIYAIARLTGHS